MKPTFFEISGLLVFLALPTGTMAQIDEDMRRQPYVFAAPGAFVSLSAPTVEFGGGMHRLVAGGLGVGFDVSYMAFTECLGCHGMMFGSLDMAYHFVRGSKQLVPFVLGGLGGVATGEDGVSLVNWGGGVNYWFDNGVALRVELRDRFDGEGIHNVGVRIGVTF